MELSRKQKEQQVRRNYILTAAKEVFAEKGYEFSSMNEIASRAEFTKRTLYQYFADKADLYLTVLIRDFEEMVIYFSEYKYQQVIGYELIQEFTYLFYEYYSTHKDLFRILYDISKVKQVTDNPKIEEFDIIAARTTEFLLAIMKKGQDDGSITVDMSPEVLAVTYKFLLTGFFNNLTVSGETYSSCCSLSFTDFVENTLKIILKTLQS